MFYRIDLTLSNEHRELSIWIDGEITFIIIDLFNVKCSMLSVQ